ncbi:hypothetical protein OIU80_02705 [Flavobacterium sp. LS1R47]|jgi:hypothetical protein|uniref:Uncharacterized protein n=1 Tax=Flavobacterium frigoritolerans TaxID=2987686 RepID=A0A9X3C0P6_9FLAO|nr:hypothetical protein [Flavobacterium frigoritolerans]MCV9931181.1 hypothetical protein [Flavobacterium frigoritolerans]
MSTTNSSIHGVDTKIPPGVLIKQVTRNNVGAVSFPERKTTALLSPIVEAYLVDNNQELLVRAVVFVAHELQGSLSFDIYQNCYVDIEGTPHLQFFICYNMLEIVGKKFDIYEVSFNAIPIPFDSFSEITTIETFLWNTDPITSRGTETTVQAG